MTTNYENDTCSDPFNPIDNRLENECLATSKDNIMDSTRSSDSTGNFRLKNFNQIKGVRMQGTITLCSHDGCNQTNLLTMNSITIVFFVFLCLVYQFE
ncbi:unnamed protein product [Rotaria socialis]